MTTDIQDVHIKAVGLVADGCILGLEGALLSAVNALNAHKDVCDDKAYSLGIRIKVLLYMKNVNTLYLKMRQPNERYNPTRH